MNFKAIEIATYLNGKVEGDGNATVSDVSKIEEAKPGTLAFLANVKYEKFIYQTQASIVLVNKDFVAKEKISTTLIRVEDSYKAFASLLDLYIQSKANLKTGIEQPSFIDTSASVGEDIFVGAFAYISKNAKIGKGVKIYPQAFVGENVTIGDYCIIYSGAKIYDDVVIGDRCILHSGSVIGADGFGFAPEKDGTYKKIPQIGNVVLESDVEIGANTTVDCGTMGSTIVHKGAKIDNLVQVAHNCEIGENTVIAGQTGVSGSTKIGKNCVIAGQVGFSGHITVGDNCMVGAQSGIPNNVKSNSKIFGSPAFEIREAMRAYSIFRNLPKLRNDVIDLQKQMKSLNTDKKDSTN